MLVHGKVLEQDRSLCAWHYSCLSLVNAMRKVWITESVLCSNPKPRATIERFCAEQYLLPQLRLFPNATVAAMGSKAAKRLKRYKDQIPHRIVECGAVFPPGCNFPDTKSSWDKLAEVVTQS